jgi:hypothetical protein
MVIFLSSPTFISILYFSFYFLFCGLVKVQQHSFAPGMARSIFFVVYLLSSCSVTRAISVPGHNPQPRDSSTCPSSFSRCPDSKLPANFCCPVSTTCISLDNSSSAICCPGGDCSFIQPVTCNIQAQNSTANPQSTLKTTRLTESLPKCGGSCCPFGYTCQANSMCVIDKTTSSTVTSDSPSSTSVSPASIAVTPASTLASSISASDPTTSPLPGLGPNATVLTQQCPAFPGRAVVAGFFPGLICGAIAALLVSMCLRRREQRYSSSKLSSLRHRSSGGTIIGISEPIPSDAQSSFRTDFLLRKDNGRNAVGTKSMFQRTGTRVKRACSQNPNHPILERPKRKDQIPPLQRSWRKLDSRMKGGNHFLGLQKPLNRLARAGYETVLKLFCFHFQHALVCHKHTMLEVFLYIDTQFGACHSNKSLLI